MLSRWQYMHHRFLRSMTNSRGILLCIRFLLCTRSVTSLPLSIFYRKIKKICHLRETHHQIHCTCKEATLVPIRRTKCGVIPDTPLEWPGSAAISLLCCPCLTAFTCKHLRLAVPTGHPVCFKLCWPGLRGGPELSPGELRCGFWPPDKTGACSAFQHS